MGEQIIKYVYKSIYVYTVERKLFLTVEGQLRIGEEMQLGNYKFVRRVVTADIHVAKLFRNYLCTHET